MARIGLDRLEPTPNSATIADTIGPSDHVVFVLADGLGMGVLDAWPSATFLREHVAMELRSVFPSATAPALASLATGRWPSAHAITGWWTHISQIGSSGSPLQFVKRGDGRLLTNFGVTAEHVFPYPSLASDIPRETLTVYPSRIAQSVYSEYASGGQPRRGYTSLRQAVDIILEADSVPTGPKYTYLYSPSIDIQAHAWGIHRQEVRAAVMELDREMERLAKALGGRGRIVLTADHGMLDIPEGGRHHIRRSDGLLADLRYPPSGDARVAYFHTRDGERDHVIERLRQRLGDGFFVLTREEVQRLQLFGPEEPEPLTKERLGDVVAISGGGEVVEYHPQGTVGKVKPERSHHSGLTPDEMRIPLIIA